MDDAVMREDGPLQKPTVIPTPKVEMEVAKVEEMANAMAWALARIDALEIDNARLKIALEKFDMWDETMNVQNLYQFTFSGDKFKRVYDLLHVSAQGGE